jgi:hypothetical protein
MKNRSDATENKALMLGRLGIEEAGRRQNQHSEERH